MRLLLAAIGLLVLGALGALLAGRAPRLATLLGVGGAVGGAVLGLVPVAGVLAGGAPSAVRLPWAVPGGAFYVELDALSAFFLLPAFAVCGLAAVYGAGYLRHRGGTPASWFFFDLLVASIALVTVARNAVLFLVAWEVMALASFFLVTLDDEDAGVRAAGWTYLVASHLGTAFLLALFVLLAGAGGSLDFDRFAPRAGTDLLAALALVGFGTKAGFVPLHVWLPEAHPAAPSHVSAVMSGVMIKTGVYGIVRVLGLLDPVPAWCGPALVAVGLVSGVLGVLYALAQQDLKRLLAYSSVENVGVVALGLGVGLIGRAAGAGPVAALGFAGALLHVLGHGVFKSLLFLGAGAVLHASGVRSLDRLGGLLARMPRTGTAFLVGAAASAGLPPLAGFAAELLVYLAAFEAVRALGAAGALPALATVGGLALIGGLAAACFAKAFGVAFLGSPRSAEAAAAHEPGAAMWGPMAALAAGAVAIGLASPVLVLGLVPVLGDATGLPADVLRAGVAPGARALAAVAACGLGLALLAAALWALRARLLAGRAVRRAAVWDCGYAAPSPRMQYTGASFSQPLVDFFALVLRPRRGGRAVEGLFPPAAAFATETPDAWRERLYGPALRGIGRGLAAFRWLQHGHVQLYVLYVALTLLALLVWKLGAR
jgi:hydrogenase-4 component B